MAKSKKKKELVYIHNEEITLSEEQQKAFDLINNTLYNVFIQGSAGSGKSCFIEYLKRNLKKSSIVCSPTAIAAMNVGGMTLHSFFQLPVSDFITEKMLYKFNRKKLNEILQYIQVLIIDEVSMVRPDILDAINNICQYARRDKTRPFGGIQVVLVGDVYQLPPVITSQSVEIFEDFYGTKEPYFFDADVYKKAKFQKIEFTQIYRQKSDELLNMLNNLRFNKNLKETLAYFNNCKIEDQNIINNAVTITPYRAMTDQINKQKLNTLKGDMISYKAILEGSFEKAKSFPADKELQLKEGALVVFIRNNKPDWINGSMGIVVDLKPDVILVKMLDTGNTVFVTRETWEEHKYEMELDEENKKHVKEITIGKFEQFPLQLGYSLTIHKAQGKTLDKVVINMDKGAFAHGQLYVALSRTRNKDDIHMVTPVYAKDSIISPRIIEFMS